MAIKYVQIAALLRSAIKSGAFQDTMRLPTEMELSAKYQVNRQTVRRALAMLAQEGLIERRQGSGSYIQNIFQTSSSSIAIVATYINDYIFPSILQDVQTTFDQNGYSTMVFCTYNKVNMERKILSDVLEHPVRALLVEGTKTALPNPNLDLYKRLHASGIPVVFLHGSYPALQDSICISDDNFHGGYLLAQYLLKKGHREIAGIFKSDDIQGQERYAGFLAAFRNAGLPLPEAHIQWYTTEDKIQILKNRDSTFLKNFIAGKLRGCTAVVCYNDEIAFSLINYLTDSHVRVPEEMAVVSFDNSTYSELCCVKITSLAHGTNHIGRIAAETLIDMLNGKNVQSKAVPWILAEKESS